MATNPADKVKEVNTQSRNPYADYIDEGYKKLVTKYGDEQAAALQKSWNGDDSDSEGRAAYLYQNKDDLVNIYNKMQSGQPLDENEKSIADNFIVGWDKPNQQVPDVTGDQSQKIHPAEKGTAPVARPVQQPGTVIAQPVVTQPQEQQAVVKPVVQNTYLYDYGSMSMADAYKQGKHTPREIMLDRYKWGEENGKPMNWIEASYFQNADLDKTKADAEKEEKRKKWEEAFEHMGHGLISLGNFVGAITGAPAPSNMVDSMALTDRQRKLRELTRAQRDAYNKDFFANYWKERAEERQRERDQALASYRLMQGQAAQQKAESQVEKNQADIRLKDAKTGQIISLTPAQVEKLYADAQRSRQSGNAAIMNAQTRQNAESRIASGSTVETNNGRRPTVRTTRWNNQNRSSSSSGSSTQRVKVDY